MRLLITALIVSLAGCASIGPRAATTRPRVASRVDSRLREARVHDPSRQATTLRQRATGATTLDRTAALQTAASGRSLDVPRAQGFSNILQGGTWTRDRWTTLLRNVLSNDKLADAAIWIGSAPLRVKISGGGFFVAVRVATP